MKMKKICQGAVIFTALHAQASAFAEPKNGNVENQKNAASEESQSESEASFFDFVLPDVVTELMNRVEHSGNEPIC